MLIEVFAPDGAHLGTIDTFQSALWLRRYFEPGEFQLIAPARRADLALLLPGNLLCRTDRTETVIVTALKTEQNTVTATGRMLSYELRRGIVLGEATYTGTPAEVMCSIAEQAKRAIPQLEVPRNDLPTGDPITIVVKYKNVLDTLVEISKAYGLGFRLRYTPQAEAVWRFEVYDGKDLRATKKMRAGQKTVQFTEEFGNLASPCYTYSVAEYATVAYVVGGDGTVRTITADPAPAATSEIYVDCSNLAPGKDLSQADYLARLDEAGRQALAANVPAENFEYKAANVPTFEYLTDWDLGDLVTADSSTLGVTIDNRVTEVQESEENGVLTITPTVGSTEPETMDLKGG